MKVGRSSNQYCIHLRVCEYFPVIKSFVWYPEFESDLFKVLWPGGCNPGHLRPSQVPKVVQVLARNQLDDSFSASPAVVGKELYLRGQANLYCLAEAPPAPE